MLNHKNCESRSGKIKDSKKRVVAIVEQNIADQFSEIARKEGRTMSSHIAYLMQKVVEENTCKD